MATKLVDMKRTKAEIKADIKNYDTLAGQHEYPWGLEIRLEDEELNKLGIKNLPNVGQAMTLTIYVEVQSATETKMADGKTNRCVCLQITRMGADEPEGDAAAAPTPAPKAAKQPSKGGVLGRG